MGGRLRRFLEVAGVEPEERQALMDLYLFNKLLFTAQEVDFVIAASESQLGPLQTLHVPGHCPGQIVLRLGDVLLTSDHVLPDITPHMAPGSLAEHTGLAEYLRSLDLLAGWADGARLALGGHGPPMTDVLGRIAEIRRHHEARLEAVLDALRPPAMMVNVADRLFPTAGGYHRLLALEEVGAHMEYLGAQGRVRSAGGEMDRPAVFQRSDAAQGGSAARLRAARR
jgi:glyoxylase-like metal-dependent hydrolase (beta-lactamase superfamily II)